MVPPAPATFSMMICCLSAAPMVCPRRRATVSVGPPAENGTTMVITFDGYSCAQPAPEAAEMATNPSTAATIFIVRHLPLWLTRWKSGARPAPGAGPPRAPAPAPPPTSAVGSSDDDGHNVGAQYSPAT